MTNFDNILNWKLLSGSHEFPGSQGGTCINEAALVAMGFEYRAIRGADDMPPCTSRVIASYALRLNDGMDDAARQLLIPFVTRILGTADTPEVERQRTEFLAIGTVKRILPVVLRAHGFKQHAAACEKVEMLAQARDAARAADADADAYAAYAYAARAARAAADADADAAYADADAAYAYAAADAAAAAADAARAAYARADKAAIWNTALELLDGAMQIGKQPDELDVRVVKQRMDAARELAHA